MQKVRQLPKSPSPTTTEKKERNPAIDGNHDIEINIATDPTTIAQIEVTKMDKRTLILAAPKSITDPENAGTYIRMVLSGGHRQRRGNGHQPIRLNDV